MAHLFSGFSWKVGYCPTCGQPLGWIWRKDNFQQLIFYGIRLDKIVDWTNWLLGPLVQLPGLFFA